MSPDMGPEWRPSVCKMLINFERNMSRISVHVDPGHPAAWRCEPYYGYFKAWSRRFAGRKVLIVFIKRKAIAILPDKEVDLGEVDTIDDIRIFVKMTPQGPTWNAVKSPSKQS